ncbi:hypothetical protein HID58_022166 [Brassica napus]|uniref:Uncharacterized protein n=1 Tax=Brassica napus TaxID=3708 RepID=A0ABQ8D012_BRANA|nr:hypothetical protein HID58_022166 [Brassica napus]
MTTRENRVNRWKRPMEDWIKCNYDGSYKAGYLGGGSQPQKCMALTGDSLLRITASHQVETAPVVVISAGGLVRLFSTMTTDLLYVSNTSHSLGEGAGSGGMAHGG